MKTLSVRQPWATLLVSGLKDIENRTWAPNHKGRILIHASQAKVTKKFPDQLLFQQFNIIDNEQMFGNLPEYKDMDYSAIIGYVTVDGDSYDAPSLWAEPVEHQWHIKDAYIFDEPIRGVKGKLNLFDTPEIDENHLPPAHKYQRRAPRLEGETLIVPLTEENLEIVLEVGQINLCATEEVCNLVQKPEEELKEGEYAFKPISRVRIETPTRKMTFEVEDMGYQSWIEPDGTTKMMMYNWDADEIEYFDIGFGLKNGVIDE